MSKLKENDIYGINIEDTNKKRDCLEVAESYPNNLGDVLYLMTEEGNDENWKLDDIK